MLATWIIRFINQVVFDTTKLHRSYKPYAPIDSFGHLLATIPVVTQIKASVISQVYVAMEKCLGDLAQTRVEDEVQLWNYAVVL